MRLFILSVVALIALASCGKKIPSLATPGDGQTFTLGNNSFTYFDATLADNDYNDVTISVKGDLPPNEVGCTGGQGGPLRCQLVNAQGQQVAAGNTCIPGCTVVITATRGDQKDVRTVRFVRPTQ